MKTYCRGLVVDRDVVERAYEEWLSHEAGRKNRRRVEREHGRIFLSQGFDRLHDAGVAARAGVVLAAGGVAAVDPGRGRVRVVGVHDRKFEVGCMGRLREKRQCEEGAKEGGETHGSR